jgi:hypothetical protein
MKPRVVVTGLLVLSLVTASAAQNAAARKSFAKTVRKKVVKQMGRTVAPGFNISAEGPDATVYVYHESGVSSSECTSMLATEGFAPNLRKFGFTQIVCTDDAGARFTFDLTAQQQAQQPNTLPANANPPVSTQPALPVSTDPVIPQQAQSSAAPSYPQDAVALEAQYKTCAKHYIPAEKCTPEIYQQLRDTDNAPLDPLTASALQAVRYYQTRLKNPASLQVHTAYVTDRGDICLAVGAQNGLGGMTVSYVVYLSNGRWLDEGGLGGALTQQNGGGVNRWPEACTKGAFHPKLVTGTDVTEKVNQALNDH